MMPFLLSIMYSASVANQFSQFDAQPVIANESTVCSVDN